MHVNSLRRKSIGDGYAMVQPSSPQRPDSLVASSPEMPHHATQGKSLWLWHLLTAVVMAAASICYVAVSGRWRIMVDSSVMHTVVFLMRHGRAPYTQISDNNMPGAYFVEALGMQLFGLGDLGWRLFEFSLLAVLTAGLVDLARRWDAFAGIFAAGFFIVIHSAEGPQYAAERELTLTTLLVVAFALLFRAVEANRPWLLAFFGLATGLAASIKPTCLPLALLALGVACAMLHRRGRTFLPALLYGLGGLAVVFAADLAFLVRFQALGAFRFILQHVIPAYVGLGTPVSLPRLLFFSLPKLAFPLLLLWPFLLLMNLRREGPWTWQHWTLLLCAAFGFFSYLVQRKGYLHHRYTFEVFLVLLIGIEIFRALRQPGRPRLLAAVALLF